MPNTNNLNRNDRKRNPQNRQRPTRKSRRTFGTRLRWNSIVVALCLIGFSLYIAQILLQKADQSKIYTDYLSYGDVKSIIEKDMIVVRNSTVLTAPSDGTFELIFPEGVRVKKGQPVAKSTSQESAEDYNELLSIIDSRISDIDNPNVLIGVSNDLSAMNNRLESLYRNAQTRIQNDEIEYIESLKQDIRSLNDKKSLYFSGDEGITKTQLLQQRAEILEKKNTRNTTVYTSTIGIVSGYIDGFEGVLNIPNMLNLSVAQLKKIQNTDSIDYSRQIKKGDPVVAIVDNEKWYLVCEVTKEDIGHIASGKEITIVIEDISFSAVLEDFYKDKQGKFVGYFRVEDDTFQFYQKRSYPAQIIYKSSKGIAIPNSALIERDGVLGIFVVERTGVANFKPIIEIAAQDEKFTAIAYQGPKDQGADAINIYDEVILNPKGIEEGDRIK